MRIGTHGFGCTPGMDNVAHREAALAAPTIDVAAGYDVALAVRCRQPVSARTQVQPALRLAMTRENAIGGGCFFVDDIEHDAIGRNRIRAFVRIACLDQAGELVVAEVAVYRIRLTLAVEIAAIPGARRQRPGGKNTLMSYSPGFERPRLAGGIDEDDRLLRCIALHRGPINTNDPGPLAHAGSSWSARSSADRCRKSCGRTHPCCVPPRYLPVFCTCANPALTTRRAFGSFLNTCEYRFSAPARSRGSPTPAFSAS